jgi:ornithine cyclodeaminase/alanine dehydrogenase-like protein (mu-crystallin family)
MFKVMMPSRAAVLRHLSIADCIPIIDRALRDISTGCAIQPVCTQIAQPDVAGALGLMPGCVRESRALGIKVVTVFEGSFARGLLSHRGALLLFDVVDGALNGICARGGQPSRRPHPLFLPMTEKWRKH